MIFLMFGLAILVGVLVGLGARTWTRQYAERPILRDEERPPLPSVAVDLGYKREEDYQSDRLRAVQATLEVLQGPPGGQRLWENAETGNRGVIWGAEEKRASNGALCRDLERRTLINSAFRNASAVACRDAQGRWSGEVAWHAD